jgi:hypothetical protein
MELMAKHSKHERERRAAEAEHTKELASAWFSSLPGDVAAAFSRDVAAARSRGPLPPRPDMAPGTAPTRLARATSRSPRRTSAVPGGGPTDGP